MSNRSRKMSLCARAVAVNNFPTLSRIGTLLFGLLMSSLVFIAPAEAATIIVGNANDSGVGNAANCDAAHTCTLRDAITKAAAATGTAAGDTIVFNLPSESTITLAINELAVDKNLTIDGRAVSGLAISGNHWSRVFRVSSGATVALRQLAIMQGREIGEGGGILNFGNLTLTDSTVTDNVVRFRGGTGIDNVGTLKLINSTVANNSSNSSCSQCSGINNSGTLILIGSTVAGNSGRGINSTGATTLDNSAISFNAGGGVFSGSQLTSINSNILGNAEHGILSSGIATITGGAVSGNHQSGISNSGTLTLTDNTISDNALSGIYNNAGTIVLTRSTVSHNTGGGVYNSGTLTLINSVVSNNSTDSPGGGGGIKNLGTLTLAASTVSRNTAVNSGGGIMNSSQLTLTDSTVSGNKSGYGGGIENYGALTLTDSTVAGNTATSSGGGCGGIRSSGVDRASALILTRSTVSNNTSSSHSSGGICSSYGTVVLIDSTVAGNQAATGLGGGIQNYVDVYGNDSDVMLINSTIADNTAAGIHSDIYNSNGSAVASINTIIRKCEPNGSNAAPLTDNGGNLDGGTGCGFTDPSSKSNATLDLGALADNGGPTLTMMPGANSDAIGRGVPSTCVSSPVNSRDQRGYVRSAIACTSGAVDPGGAANDSIFFDGFGFGGQ